MNIATKIYIYLFCTKVGEDSFGNKYYVSKNKNAIGKAKRMIVYNGEDEPANISPMWHAWLHYSTDDIPKLAEKYSWQKERFVVGVTKLKKRHLSGIFCKTYESWDPSIKEANK